jgi:hypothetical protein
MKITSTTITGKRNLQRPQPHRADKKAKKVAHVVKKVRPNNVEDTDLIDLTDEIDLVALSFEGKVKHSPKDKEARRETVRMMLAEIQEQGKKFKPLSLGKKVPQKKNGESLCMLFSDWHVGKVIKTRSGKHIFDSAIAIDRITNEIPEQFEDYISNRVSSKNIEEIVIFFAGDIVDNDIIYPGQRLHVDNGVAVQFRDAINAIHIMIKKFRLAADKHIGKNIPIRIECITGNHGRAGKDSETPICSWDTAAYAALDLTMRASNATNIEIGYSLEDQRVTNVRGLRALMIHHLPPQTETPSAKKTFGGLYEIFDYDFVVYGDLHHWGVGCWQGKPSIMNGSLCGYDDYAISLALRDDWSQLMWIVTDSEPIQELTRFKRRLNA